MKVKSNSRVPKRRNIPAPRKISKNPFGTSLVNKELKTGISRSTVSGILINFKVPQIGLLHMLFINIKFIIISTHEFSAQQSSVQPASST
jgi:hypothetical protein